MKKKIAIRVDADNKIGIGHLLRIKGFIYRSINEYEKFLVITKSNKKLILNHLSHKKIKIFFLKKNRKEQIYQILLNQNCKLLLSDISNLSNLANKGYFKNYHNFFKRNKIISVSIDDPRQFINSHISFVPYPVDAYQLKKDKKTKLFLGVKYICFNKDIKIKPKKIVKIPKKILILISGASSQQINSKIVKHLLTLDAKLHIKIVINGLKKSKQINIKKNIINYINEKNNINSLLNWSDIAIIGEGLIRFEASAKGVPNIFINNVENNDKNFYLIKKYLNIKSSIFIKKHNLKKNNFLFIFKNFFHNWELRKKLSKNGTKNFDLKGCIRINNIIKNFNYANFS